MASYYAIIPATVRYDKRLKDKAKLLYGEITALATEKGYCWSKNKFFADLYEISEETVSRLIKNLSDAGYIKISYIMEGSKIKERRIYINDVPLPLTEKSTVDEKINGTVDEKINGTVDENVKDNNTSINNTSINKKEKVKKEKEPSGLDNLIECYTDNPKLRETILDFIKMRKAIKKPVTDKGLSLIFKKLDKYSGGVDDYKISMLENSIENSWQGVFELKDVDITKQKNQGKEEKPKERRIQYKTVDPNDGQILIVYNDGSIEETGEYADGN